MSTKDFAYTFTIDQSPKQAFDVIKDVRSWWSGLYSEEIHGHTDQLGEEFTFRAGGDVHYSKQKLVELIPDQRLVWLVTESRLSFLEKQNEWTGSKLIFDISRKGNKTEVRFTHQGLVPQIECHGACSDAWTRYLKEKLQPLIANATKG